MININNQKLVSTLLLATMSVIGAGSIAMPECFSSARAEQFTPLQGKVIYVPSGTIFPATATMELSSESLELGQSVCIALSQDFYYNNTLIAPIGSSVNGTVIQVKKALQQGVNGSLQVKFTNIITPYGQMIPLSGKIQTDDGSGIIKGESHPSADNTKIVDTTAAATAGAVAGAATTTNMNKKNPSYKTAAAAAAGAAAAQTILNKGVAAVIPAGTVINIVLDQQITFTPQKK